MKTFSKYTLIFSVMGVFWAVVWNTQANADNGLYPFNTGLVVKKAHVYTIPEDTTKLKFPFKDYSNDPVKNYRQKSPLHLKDPATITTDFEYDYKTGDYNVIPKVGSLRLGFPSVMSADDYRNFSNQTTIRDYWHERYMLESQNNTGSSRLFDKYLNPKLNVDIQGFDKIFGTNVIDIKPQGSAELIFGLNINKTNDPTLPVNQQRNVTFDFDEKIQMGVTGQLGDKMKIGINYNTEATFDFENQSTIEYTGHDDEIIQKIEAGDVGLPLKGTLIQGSTTLFGLKTDLKFGKLDVTTLVSQQKGETDVIEIKGGAILNDFKVSAGEYEENRHFFLGHYFKDNYERSLQNLPIVSSNITISKLEIWVTNENLSTENTRDIVAFVDMGEAMKNVSATTFISASSTAPGLLPANAANSLYKALTTQYAAIRDINRVSELLQGKLESGFHYEKVGNARKLEPSEYTVNYQLGYVSLNVTLDDDDVLAVAYEYTQNGKTYKVGEFSSGDVEAPNALFLKLLKGTSFSPRFPNWELMMKNVYSIGAYQINPENFELGIYYQDDATGTALNYLPAGDISGKILLNVYNLDNSNNQLEPYPDGFFDFIQGVTIIPANGRIFFPVLNPFGSYLSKKINDPAIAAKYVYNELYDSTQTKALQVAEKNKFFIKGAYRSSGGSDISLNAFNIPQGSVKVTSGGMEMVEGQDFLVDYMAGRVTILNQSLLSSGSPIKVTLESNSMFNIQTKTLLGAHLNYNINSKFSLGGTILRLSEKPMTYKVGIGDEPISNTIWGFNADYTRDLPFLTHWVDAIPFINTKAPSSITFNGEFASLIPGHSRAIDKSGTSYIDDFEAAQTTIDLKSPVSWVIASAPQGVKAFSEAKINNSLVYGFNRAKLAWYFVNSDFLRDNTATPGHLTLDDKSNHLVREVYEKEIFPNKESPNGLPTLLSVLNLAYYPTERGPYNFDVEGEAGISAGMESDGSLKRPQSRWGGIMRQLQTNDFEAANIEYIEFWMLDPFVYDSLATGGDLVLNLGQISEDILRDGRKSFENGLPYPYDSTLVDSTHWGLVSRKQFIINAFDNNPEARKFQDLGYDGINTQTERNFFDSYLNRIAAVYGSTSVAYEKAFTDPSADDYHFFRGADYDNLKYSILDRYKNYNSTEGNSATADQSGEDYSTTKDRLPDVEDINLDNTLSENETYFQYKVSLRPEDMVVGRNYITNISEATVKLRNDKKETVKWYQFKIPVYEPDSVVGVIQDFKSIRFMRMYLTGFDESVVLRFAKLDLVRGDWRKYNFSLNEPSEIITNVQQEDYSFEISTVNIEENGNKTPVNYILPPGVTREFDVQNPQLRQLNEQAMVLKVYDLPDGEAAAAYRNIAMDVRQYKNLKMFIHAEALPESYLNSSDLSVFVRIGSDYKENYYEYEIPLTVTKDGFYTDTEADRLTVWPDANNINIEFELLQLVKQQRNDAQRKAGSNVRLNAPFSIINDGRKITVTGNPNLSNIRTIMIGIRNPNQQTNYLKDDGLRKSGEIWVNEFRLTDFREDGGWAANARLNTKFADFADITIAGYTHTPGFGSIEKKVSERYKETVYEYDVTSQLQMGKFFPQKYGVNIPVYAGFSESYSIPQYNPLDPDIELKTALKNPELSNADRQKLLNQSVDYEQRKSFNLTNVRINGLSDSDKRERKGKEEQVRPKTQINSDQKGLLHISNFSTSFAYNESFARNIHYNYKTEQVVATSLDYNFTNNPKNIKPFAKFKFLRSKSLALIRDFNFYYAPTQITLRGQINRNYMTQQNRTIVENVAINPIFQKDFMWARTYDIRYKLSNSLRLDFTANNQSRVRPEGWIDTKTNQEFKAQDTIFMQIFDLGRNTDYTQTINLNWNVPINKIPLLDWTNLTARYQADYIWKRNLDPISIEATDTTPEYQVNLGNTINNAGVLTLNGQLAVMRLYTKVPYLKKVNQRFTSSGRKPPKLEKEIVEHKLENVKLRANIPKYIKHRLKTQDVAVKVVSSNGAAVNGKMEVIDKDQIKFTPEADIDGAQIVITGKRDAKENPLIIISDYLLYTAMGVRNISVTYKNQSGNKLPGFLPVPQVLGSDIVNNIYSPGYEYLLGLNDQTYHTYAANNNWLVKDSLLNLPVSYLKGTDYSIRATIEPLNNLKIDVNFDRAIMFNTDDYFLYSFSEAEYRTESRIEGGNFRMSYNMIRTSFIKVDETNYNTETFVRFLGLREEVAQNLAQNRLKTGMYDPTPITDSAGALVNGFYPNGYNELSQDVLVPSFLAAYTGRTVTKSGISAFPKIPLPNWRLTYNAIPDFKFLKDLLRSLSIMHGYSSSYNVGSFRSNPNFNYTDENLYGYSFTRYENSELFIPKYELGSVTIEEKFVPLIGVDIGWKGTLNTKLEYRKTRMLTLSLANNIITEAYRKEYVFGIGYKVAQLPINLKVSGSTKSFKSDLNIRFDFTYTDDFTVIRKIQEDFTELSAGQRNLSIRSSADYQLNERFQVRLFYDHVVNTPRLSTSFPNSNIKFGFSVRFILIP